MHTRQEMPGPCTDPSVGPQWTWWEGGARGERTRSRRPGGVIRRLTCPKGVRANRSQPRVGAEPGQEPRGLESGRTPSLGYVLSSPVCTPQGGARPWYRVCPGGPTSSGPHPSPPLHSSFHTEPGFSVEGLAPPPTPGRAHRVGQSAHLVTIGSGKSHDPI